MQDKSKVNVSRLRQSLPNYSSVLPEVVFLLKKYTNEQSVYAYAIIDMPKENGSQNATNAKGPTFRWGLCKVVCAAVKPALP